MNKKLLISGMFFKGWFLFILILFAFLNGVMFFQWNSDINYFAMFNAIVIYLDAFFIVAFFVFLFSFIFKKDIFYN